MLTPPSYSFSQVVTLKITHPETRIFSPNHFQFDPTSVKIKVEKNRDDWANAHAEISKFFIRIVSTPIRSNANPLEITVTATQKMTTP